MPTVFRGPRQNENSGLCPAYLYGKDGTARHARFILEWLWRVLHKEFEGAKKKNREHPQSRRLDVPANLTKRDVTRLKQTQGPQLCTIAAVLREIPGPLIEPAESNTVPVEIDKLSAPSSSRQMAGRSACGGGIIHRRPRDVHERAREPFSVHSYSGAARAPRPRLSANSGSRECADRVLRNANYFRGQGYRLEYCDFVTEEDDSEPAIDRVLDVAIGCWQNASAILSNLSLGQQPFLISSSFDLTTNTSMKFPDKRSFDCIC
ncbi:hypothetical protein EVAR_26861_1 [Eumeta japonica]|uniref:Uncharacterized protein n=1 Tax=Eumeta variegata TaxID=151549 RepID=A0A4C1VZD4_EUMVA|nr:hypothetical protein EVAR_26861_1 [Eumeta japonica]